MKARGRIGFRTFGGERRCSHARTNGTSASRSTRSGERKDGPLRSGVSSAPPNPTKKAWDDAPGVIGITAGELPALPDDVLTNPESGRIDPRGWFAESGAPLHVEIGTGKGTFLVEQAPRSAGVNYLGIEWEREFYVYTADRLRRRHVRNVRMLHANAVDFLHWRVPAACVEVIHLYYSDPWPKARHHKNRVVQHRFLADAWRVLRVGGELRVVTDHDELWAWCVGHFRWWAEMGPLGGEGDGSAWPVTDHGARELLGAFERSGAGLPFEADEFRPPEWVEAGGIVGTNYERKFTDAGHRPHSVVLRKRAHRG